MRYAARLYIGLKGLEKISKVLSYFRPKKTSPIQIRYKNLEGAIQKVNKEIQKGLTIVFNVPDPKMRNFYKHEFRYDALRTMQHSGYMKDDKLEHIVGMPSEE
jgi:hypothetical protein